MRRSIPGVNIRPLLLIAVAAIAASLFACRASRETGLPPQDPSVPVSQAEPNTDSPPGQPDRTVFQPSRQDTPMDGGVTDAGASSDGGSVLIRDVPNAPPDPRVSPRSGRVIQNADAGF